MRERPRPTLLAPRRTIITVRRQNMRTIPAIAASAEATGIKVSGPMYICEAPEVLRRARDHSGCARYGVEVSVVNMGAARNRHVERMLNANRSGTYAVRPAIALTCGIALLSQHSVAIPQQTAVSALQLRYSYRRRPLPSIAVRAFHLWKTGVLPTPHELCRARPFCRNRQFGAARLTDCHEGTCLTYSSHPDRAQ